MIVIEEFKWISGMRVTDKTEYNSIDDWEKDAFINTLSGTHVGYKIYNCNMTEFDNMTGLQRSQNVIKQKFDKAAYRGEKT